MSFIGSSEVRTGMFGLLALIAVMIAFGSATAPKPAPAIPRQAGYHGLPDPNVDAEGTAAEIEKLARRTGGDYSKLSYDERVWIEAISANHGDLTLKAMAKRYTAKTGKKRTRSTDLHRSKPQQD